MDKGAWWATVHGVTKSQTKGKGIKMKQMQEIISELKEVRRNLRTF